jgi:hypothetical protein
LLDGQPSLDWAETMTAIESCLSGHDAIATICSKRQDSRMSKRFTIHMPLLNEGISVWRIVEAEQVTDDCYMVLGKAAEDEDWAFPSGTVVRCEERTFSDGQAGLAAVEGVWRRLKTTFLEYLERQAATEPRVRDLLERTDREALNITSAKDLSLALKASGATFDQIKEVSLYHTRYSRALCRASQGSRLKVRRVP